MKREVFVRMCEKEEREITQFQMQGGGERREHIILHILLGREMQE